VATGLRRLLSDQEVTVVDSGAEALARCRAAAWDLVLTDLVMPGMTGLELAEHLDRERLVPDGRLVFMTGAALDPAQEEAMRRRGPVLAKPVDRARLASLLRKVAMPAAPAAQAAEPAQRTGAA
jgi:CheY-like chemotaxis protein